MEFSTRFEYIKKKIKLVEVKSDNPIIMCLIACFASGKRGEINMITNPLWTTGLFVSTRDEHNES